MTIDLTIGQYSVEYSPDEGVISVEVNGGQFDLDDLYVIKRGKNAGEDKYIELMDYLEAKAFELYEIEHGDINKSEYV